MSKNILLFVLIVLSSIVPAATKNNDECPSWVRYLTASEIFPASPLKVFDEEVEKIFLPDNHRANFTYLENVDDIKVNDGILSFKMKADNAVLGWGNYLGKQDPSEVKDYWPYVNIPVLRITQNGSDKLNWSVTYWSNGKPIKPGTDQQVSVKGNDWCEIRLPAWKHEGWNQPPDGMAFHISGKPGTKISIAWVKLVEPRVCGCFRKVFNLSEDGSVWRAIADLSGQTVNRNLGMYMEAYHTEFYINGIPVKRKPPLFPGGIVSVDLKPYLKSGKNVVACRISGPKLNKGFIYLNGEIIFASGKSLSVRTDKTWKCIKDIHKNENWLDVDYPDIKWQNAECWNPGQKNNLMRHTILPAYKGILEIQNAKGTKLYFPESRAVCVNIIVPDGMKKRNPVLEYVLEKIDKSGKCRFLKSTTSDDFIGKNKSMVCSIQFDSLSPGVYCLSLRLHEDDKTVAEHLREPLVVMRDKQKKVNGTHYTEGLDLELENIIDFTREDSRFPSVEAQDLWAIKNAYTCPLPTAVKKAKIVKKNGLVYREGGIYRNTISYRLPHFRNPGDFYLMELEYPDNEEREIEIAVESIHKKNIYHSSSAGAATGGKYYSTGKMVKLQWLHVADPGVNILYVMNEYKKKNIRAAVAFLKIFHIKGPLPSVDNPDDKRLFGVLLERTTYPSGGFAEGFGVPLDIPAKVSPMQEYVMKLRSMFDTCDRLTQYLKFAGQNVHAMGTFQYNEVTALHRPHFQVETARIFPDPRNILAHIFSVNDIAFYGNIQFCRLMRLVKPVTNIQISKGEDTVWNVDAKGRQRPWNTCDSQNWLHPDVQNGLIDICNDLCRHYGSLSGFKGFVLQTGSVNFFRNYLYPGYLDIEHCISFDDATFSAFEKNTGIKLPVERNSPERFRERCRLIQTPQYRQAFIDWRCREAKKLLEKILMAMKHYKKDAELLCTFGLIPGIYGELCEKVTPFKDSIKLFAVDADLYKNTDSITFGQSAYCWSYYGGNGVYRHPYAWIPGTDEKVIKTFNKSADNYTFINMHPHEGRASIPGTRWAYKGKIIKADWIANTHKVRRHGQPSGFNVREVFIQALIGSDPTRILFGFSDRAYPLGFGQELRKFSQVYTRLPKETFVNVLNTGFKTNIVLRQLVKESKSWFYVINPGYWSIDAKITIKTGGSVSAIIPFQKFEIQKEENNTSILSVKLEPYDLIAFQVDSGKLEFLNYETGNITESELAHMKKILKKIDNCLVVKKIAEANRDILRETIKNAQTALDNKKYAEAWWIFTDWKSWMLWDNLKYRIRERDMYKKRDDNGQNVF